MKLKTYISILTIGLMAMLTSCFDDPGNEIVLDNVAIIEINEATTAGGADLSKTYNRLIDGRRLRDSLQVNLIGPARGTPVTVNFTVAGVAPNAAQAGFHFNMLTQGSVTIPANKNVAFIYYEVIDDNIAPNEPVWKFRVTLTGADGGATLDANRAVFTRGLRTLCPYLRSNFVGTYSANEPGYGTYDVVFSVDPSDANGIINSNFWDEGWTIRYQLTAAGAVTIPTQSVVIGANTFTVDSPSAGTYDPCTFRMVVPYRVRRGATTLDNNTHTFTKK